MPRGRKPKNAIIAVPAVDHAKVLKQYKEEQKVQLELLYNDLAKIKNTVDFAQEKVSFIDEAETLGQAAFKAGRAYDSLVKVSEKLEEILDNIYEKNDVEYYNDIDNKL